jgi:hypothetical protein
MTNDRSRGCGLALEPVLRPAICHLSFVICHFEAPQLPPCAQRIPGVNLSFAGEPLAEIRGSAVKPFEPDAGNAAEGSGRWSVLRY